MSARRQFGLIWGAVAAGLVALSPLAERLAATLPACPVKTWLDLPCPSCGTTRAALALSRLDPMAALALNPLATVAWAGLIVVGLVAGSAAAIGRPLPLIEPRPTLALRLAVGSVLVANWAYLIVAGV